MCCKSYIYIYNEYLLNILCQIAFNEQKTLLLSDKSRNKIYKRADSQSESALNFCPFKKLYWTAIYNII